MNTLFICSANVGRSQIAEGYFREQFPNEGVQSAALIEDIREKYNYSPSKEVIETMQTDGIDISHQKIKLLTPQYCEEADRIILLLNPQKNTRSEFSINKMQPTKFLYENFSEKLEVSEIQDPFGGSISELIKIRDKIKVVVYGFKNEHFQI